MPDTNDNTLDKAVNDAADKLETGENTIEVDDTPAPDAAETETENEESDELSDEGKDEAIRLYKALKGPQSGAILAALAQQAGLLGPGKGPETKSEVREAKKEIKSILEDALGVEYKFLSDKLEKGLTKIFEQERADQEERFAEVRARQVEREVVDVTKTLNAETKGDYSRFEPRIAELSKEIPAGDMEVKTYLRRLYAIAKGEGTKTSTKGVIDRINRNRTDAPSRLRTTATPGEKSVIPEKKMTLNESINFAMEEITKGKR